MPQAVADPDEIERFAKSLKQFDSDLSGRMRHLKAQFSQLGETWRDQEHARFAQEFQQTMTVLERFIRDAEDHIPLLSRKAQKIREYLNQR
jgi:uncharacterized protein YukE